MERRDFIALFGAAAALMPSAAAHAETPAAAPGSLAARLIGTWGYISSVTTRRDGSHFDRWGETPQGIFVFDRGGHYAQIIIGSESRVFGPKNTCSFGTYSVDETRKVFLAHVEASSTSKLAGAVQQREIVLLTATELTYTNPITSTGASAEVRWKRLG